MCNGLSGSFVVLSCYRALPRLGRDHFRCFSHHMPHPIMPVCAKSPFKVDEAVIEVPTMQNILLYEDGKVKNLLNCAEVL